MSKQTRNAKQVNNEKKNSKAAVKDENIYIKTSSYNNELTLTTKSATVKEKVINLNCKCKRFSNNTNCYTRSKQVIKSSYKIYKNNKLTQLLKSELSNKQKTKQQQQHQRQQLNHTHLYTETVTQCICHCCYFHQYFTTPALKDSLNYTCKMKILTFCPAVLYFLLILFSSVEAGCRYEPSRSCEAICQPIATTMYDNNYQSNSLTTNNLTLESFYAGDYNCTIRALVLMPDNDWYVASLKRVVPILQVAEQRIRASGLLPSFINFDWMPQDDKCDAAFATVKAMDGIIKNCSHVIFGPVCDYSLAAVGRIAKYFNSHGTPLISVGGSTFDFEKPKTKCADEFYMLLRTGMLSFESISELTISVMKRNKWSRSIFFYDADGQRNVAGQHTCYLMMTSLGKQMRNENMTFAQYRITEKLKNRTEEMTREIGNKNSGKWKKQNL